MFISDVRYALLVLSCIMCSMPFFLLPVIISIVDLPVCSVPVACKHECTSPIFFVLKTRIGA